MEQGAKSTGAPEEGAAAASKAAQKRTKGKSRVWEKVAWFTRRSRSKDAVSGALATAEVAGSDPDLEDGDVSPSASCYDARQLEPGWVGSNSSSESGEGFSEDTHLGYRIKRSRLYPNSEIIEQHCLRPSVARALFHQMEAASCRASRGASKYSWQVKKKKSHSIPWASSQGQEALDDGLERTVSMPSGMSVGATTGTQGSRCHCSACCTCTPTQRLMGMCPAHARLSSSTTSLDTGLMLSAASCSHETTVVCSNQERAEPLVATCSPNSSFDEDVTRKHGDSIYVAKAEVPSNEENLAQIGNRDLSMTTATTDSLNHYKSNSLPMYFSKRCRQCNKPQTTHLPNRNQNEPHAQEGCSCTELTSATVSYHHNCSAAVQQPKPPSSEVDSFGSEEPISTLYERDRIEPSEYKEKRQLMRRWFSDFSDEQKNLLLKDLLKESCELPQMHLLSLHMEPRIHQGCPPNCCDIVTWLPPTLANYIMSFLDPVSLCHSSMVCRVWHDLANDVSLWRRFCTLPKWQLSRSGEQKQLIQHMLPNGNIHWKAVFSERFRLRNNWLRGRCNVRTFEGHTQGVSCVQFDDTRIVSGSSDKTIKVWNIRTNTPWSVQTLVGHSGTVRCLHLEGNRLVSGSTDKSIKVWDLSTQHTWTSIACKVTMVGHTDTVRCLQVDDEKVVSGSYDKTLKVWDIRSGRCRRTLRGHEAAVLCVQFDESKIVSGSCDKTIKLWTFEGACVMTLPGHHDAVTCLQFDARRIVSGSLDCNLKFWDVRTGQCSNTIDWKASEGHTGVVRCLQADSWRVVSASDDRTLKVWSVETGERLVTLRNHTDGVTCLQFNDAIIVSGSYDKTVKLWDFTSC